MEKTNERKPKLQLVMQMMKHLVMKLTLKVLKALILHLYISLNIHWKLARAVHLIIVPAKKIHVLTVEINE